ncbi:hypothetical protein PIB30_116217, partial [Stylosanthes scabra]|nr:hypothetical protein [Stylosanthes scabra]
MRPRRGLCSPSAPRMIREDARRPCCPALSPLRVVPAARRAGSATDATWLILP